MASFIRIHVQSNLKGTGTEAAPLSILSTASDGRRTKPKYAFCVSVSSGYQYGVMIWLRRALIAAFVLFCIAVEFLDQLRSCIKPHVA